MFQDAFIKLDPPDCEALLEEVNPHLTGGGFDPQTITVLGHDLPFYPGYRFYDLADYQIIPHLRKFIVYKPGDVTVLDWTNKPVYELNQKAPLKLNKDTVADYVRFYFKYVRGAHGRFTVAESVDEIAWNDEPPPAARKAVGKMLVPVTVNGRNESNSFHLTACFVYQNTLYKANVFVEPDGHIILNDEEVLVDDLPVLDDTLRQ